MKNKDKLIYKLYKRIPEIFLKTHELPVDKVECFIYIKEDRFLGIKFGESYYCNYFVPYIDVSDFKVVFKNEINSKLGIIANQLKFYADMIIKDFKQKNKNYNSFKTVEIFELK